jgi:hypothetical protein
MPNPTSSFYATFIPIWNDLINKVAQSNVRFDKALFTAVHQILLDSFKTGYGQISTDFNTPDYLRQNMFEANIARFAAAKTHREVLDLNILKNRATDYNDFVTQANALNIKYNSSWLKAEYDTAFSVGQTSADYYQQLSLKEYFPYLEYDTVGDQFVRHEHQILDKTIVKVGSREHNLINPPLGYNCRCRLRPLTADEVDVKRLKSDNEIVSDLKSVKVGKSNVYEQMTKYGFDKNKATSFNVFNSSTYVKAFKESGLSYVDYGLSPYKGLVQSLPTYHNAAPNATWFMDNINKNGLSKFDEIRLLDYRKNPVSWFKRNFSNNQPDAIVHALQSPDEVWLVKNKLGYEKTFLKFYQNQTTLVKTSFDKTLNEQIISTSFVKDADAFRKGIKVN